MIAYKVDYNFRDYDGSIALHPMFGEGWCGELARDGRGLLLPWGGLFSVGEAATEPPDSPTAADVGVLWDGIGRGCPIIGMCIFLDGCIVVVL